MKIKDKKQFESVNLFGRGEENQAFSQYFTGNSFLNPLTDAKRAGLLLANVTFEPACRNHWHIHHVKSGGGQILICTAGEGWYVEENKEAVSLTAGSVITIPAGIKHWHGAKEDSWFSHIAIEVPGVEASNEWCEPISEEEYRQVSKKDWRFSYEYNDAARNHDSSENNSF